MLVIVGRASAAPGRMPELTAAARRVVAATRADEGCESYGFYADLDDPDVLVGVEMWRDQAALEAHLAHEHTTDFLDEVAGLTQGEPTMTFFSAQPVVPGGTTS